MEILNNIWVALTTENELWINVQSIPLTFIDAIVSMLLFTSILNIKSTRTQKIRYLLCTAILGILCTLTMANHLKIPVLNEVLCRIYVLGIIAWMSLILAYLWSLGRNSKYEKTS